MRILIKLWGIAFLGIGGYSTYTLVNSLFIRGGIKNIPTLMLFLSIFGLLVGITLIWLGYKLLTLKKK